MRQPLRLLVLLTLAALLRPGNLWAWCVTTSTAPDRVVPATIPTSQKTTPEAVAGPNCSPVGHTPNTAGSTPSLPEADSLAAYTSQLIGSAFGGQQRSMLTTQTLALPRNLYRNQGFHSSSN